MIEARFLGPDPAVLDSLTGVAIEIMRRNPKVADARNEWGNMTMVIRPVYDPVKAGVLGITKAQMMESVKSISDGTRVGVYRDGEKKVPVLLKSEGVDITDVRSLGNFSVWNGEHSAPLSQVTERIGLSMGMAADPYLQPAAVYGCYVWSETWSYNGRSAWRNS